jgi:transcriptional regulator with XRE-family HTH domain
MDMAETFGQTLKRIRVSKGLTQRDVARKIHMDFSYYSRLEGDRIGDPTRETVLDLCRGIDATLDERNELLATAGRVGEEMQEQPLLKQLYKAAAQLPNESLEELVRQAEEKRQQVDQE